MIPFTLLTPFLSHAGTQVSPNAWLPIVYIYSFIEVPGNGSDMSVGKWEWGGIFLGGKI